MRTTVVTPTKSGVEFGSSAPSVTGRPAAPVVENASTPEDEVAHIRRRLFRTLDHPDRRLIAIDCGSVSNEQIQKVADCFFSDATFRDTHNLVLAIPTDNTFADSSSFDFVQSIKQQAFENQLDGKVSWLLIHEAASELPALANLVRQQGGQWYSA